MAKTLRITGDYTIDPTGSVIINGDLQVTGTTTTVNTTNLQIEDRLIELNFGETGAGVTGQFSGIEVERGSLDNALLVFDESDDTWKTSIDGGSTYTAIGGAGGGLNAVSDDTTPSLGGDLNVNSNSITAATNGDISLVTIGTGEVVVDSVLTLVDQASAPAGTAGETKVYAATAGAGETGLFYVDNTVTGELIQKNKAIVYAMLF